MRFFSPSISLLLFACASVPVASRSILDFSADVRQRNVVRLSREACSECTTMDAFYEANPLGFVLFYERALVQVHQYTDAIVRGFHEACSDLRWSQVVCGMVDITDDRDYALRYMDPSKGSAHIVVRDGEPLTAEKRHVDKLMKKPGDKDTILWHLRDLISPFSTEISVEVEGKKAFARLLKRHDVVIGVVLSDAKDSHVRQSFRAAAQRLMIVSDAAVLPSLSTSERGSRRRIRELERGRVLLALVRSKGALSAHGIPDGSVAVFHRGTPVRGIAQQDLRRASSELEIAELLRAIPSALKELLSDAGNAAPSGADEL